MLEIIVYGLIWCFAIYGILIMFQEVIMSNTHKKIEDMNIILTVKNAENGIETYIRNLMLEGVVCKDLIVIDLDSSDETMCILRKIENENSNIKVLNKKEGENYIMRQIS